MSRISKRTRAEAIHILDMFAGTVAAPDSRFGMFNQHGSLAAANLATEAYYRVPHHSICRETYATESAEAAGLLRDGWSPGDVVVRLEPLRCETCGQALRAEVGLS